MKQEISILPDFPVIGILRGRIDAHLMAASRAFEPLIPPQTLSFSQDVIRDSCFRNKFIPGIPDWVSQEVSRIVTKTQKSIRKCVSLPDIHSFHPTRRIRALRFPAMQLLSLQFTVGNLR
jgi:hypothetical protein